jgi:integrase
MRNRLPPHCTEEKDRHGNFRVYVRVARGGRRVRLRETPWTPAFMEAYGAALAELRAEGEIPAAKGAEKGTWAWLCQRYFASPEFKHLGERTRRVRRQILEATFTEPTKPGAKTLYRDFPLKFLTPQAIRVLRDRKAETPEAANGRVKAMRAVFAYGLAAEPDLVTANPAREVPLFGQKGEGFVMWTAAEVEQFLRRHPIGTKPALALGLLLFTGVRRSDVIKLGRQNVRDGWITFSPTKGSARKPMQITIPMLPVLEQIIEATPSRGERTFLVTEFGKPFTGDGFGNWFRRRAREAGLEGRSPHGLRKAGATIAAENGATERQLMAIFGWRSPKEAARYTEQAERRRLAGVAMKLISWDRSEDEMHRTAG